MALIKPIHGEMSGKIGGNVYARNRGGMYVRTWAKPVQPDTPLQTAVKSYMGAAVGVWTNTLTQAQRDAWTLYAANTPVVNRLGDTVYLTGQNHFIAQYVSAIQGLVGGAACSPVLNGPTSFGMAVLPGSIALTPSEGTGLSITYDNTEEWANTDGGALLVYLGQPRSNSRVFFKGPWRFCGYVDGDSVTAPTSPLVLSPSGLPFTLTEGQRVSIAVKALAGDGRYSGRVIATNVVTA